MAQVVNKKVKLVLVGLDGNAFSLLGSFKSAAKDQGWTKEEIEKVMKEAMSGEYHHLVTTLASYCEDPAGEGDEFEQPYESQDEGF